MTVAKPLDPLIKDPQAPLKRRLKLWANTLEIARKFIDDPTEDHSLMLRAEAFIWLDNLEIWTEVSDVDPELLSLPFSDLVANDAIAHLKWLLIGWTYGTQRKYIERSRIDLKDAPAWVINRAEKDILTYGTRDAIDLVIAAAVDQAMYNPHGLKYSLSQLEILDKMKAADMSAKLMPITI